MVGDATAVEFNQTVRGYICPKSDEDFYKFHVNTSGIIQIKLENVSSDMKAQIKLYNKNFQRISYKDATNAGDAVTLEKDISGHGWHYIRISNLDRKAYAPEYSFKAIFEPAPDLNEPNSVVGDATEIEFNQTVHGYICPKGDEDFYMFHVNTSGIIQIKLENVPSDMRSRIDLYGKNFNGITYKYATNAGDAVTLEKDISGQGWHYISIRDLNDKAHSEEYTFRVLLV